MISSHCFNSLFSNITNINISYVRRVAATVTTGNTGNIALPYSNDGYNYIIGALVSGANVALRAWVSAVNSSWYLTAIDPNTGATINNTELAIRYLVVSIKNINA